MPKIKIFPKRTALSVAVVVFVSFLFIYSLILGGGLFEGADTELDEQKIQLQQSENRKISVEGPFLDRNGSAITQAEEAGEPAVVLFDECYSYLIGYNCKKYGTSGLRSRLEAYLFDGGADDIGAAVTLTTDNGLQEFCYSLLDGHEGSIIVMNADTGELLACTSRSSAEQGYNVNLVSNDPEVDMYPVYNSLEAFFLNRSTMSADPPGSTFKIVCAASLLNAGLGDYVYDDLTGYFEVEGTKLYNYDKDVFGTGLDLEKALNSSINVYFASAAQKLKAYNLQITADSFLLGKPIKLDFANVMSNFDLGDMTDKALLASTAFGQGRTTMAPIHVAMIMGSVMNDGLMVKPYLISSIVNDGRVLQQTRTEYLCLNEQGEVIGVSKPNDVPKGGTSVRTMTESTAETLKAYLNSTAEGYGYTTEDYGRVYAKTGTADQANGKNHVYLLLGVEDAPSGRYVILIDQRNTDAASGSLKRDGESILNYLLSM